MMKTQSVDFPPSGVLVPMLTPLDDDGMVNKTAIAHLVDHLLAGGANGIFALGSAGEGPWLTPSQQREVVECTSRAVAGRVPVIAGVLEPSTNRSLEAVRRAESVGAEMVCC